MKRYLRLSCILILLGQIGCAPNPAENPSAWAELSISAAQQGRMVQVLKDFSSKHNYRFKIIRPTDRDGTGSNFQLSGKTMQVIGTNLFDPLKYDVGFYQNRSGPTATDADISRTADEFVAALRAQGISISREKIPEGVPD